MTAEFSHSELQHLLGRPSSSSLDQSERVVFSRQRVLITGAGGSIGSELAREIAACGPAALGLLDQSELGLFTIEREIRSRWPWLAVDVHLADVTRGRSLTRACRETRPDVVYHAAAYKHVTMAERAPAAAAGVNVIGTAEAATAAASVGARFVLISSDKAADPKSVMGATKRLAELVVLEMASPAFRPVVVRFGNVLGSSGSVIQIMRDCVRSGQPIPITDPDATRFFMTASEAVGLVLRADLLGQAAEIFWLELGEPVRMADLVARLLVVEAAAGHAAVPIQVVGLRPGEKRNEILSDRQLAFERTIDARIRVAREHSAASSGVATHLGRLRRALARADDDAALDVLSMAVRGFRPSDQARDAARRSVLLRSSPARDRIKRKRRAA